MLKGLNIQELAAKIMANQNLKQDYVADTGRVFMSLDDDKKALLNIEGTTDRGFPVLPLAHDQIGSKLAIPAKYYDRCLVEDPALLTHNVNTWFHKNPEKRMLRTLGGDLRAYLSNRYQRIENEEIAKVALPVLYDLPNVQIPTCEITDKRLYIHFVVPSIQGEVKVNDVVQAGGVITNSEVGCGSVSVSGLLWRLRCLNGMKTIDVYRQVHVGRKIEEGEMDWADDTRHSDDRTVLLKVRDMVRAVVDQTRFAENLSKMQGLTEGKISGQVGKAVEVLAKKVAVTEGEQNDILTHLAKGGDMTAWGMLNAVTQLAHDARNYDRAVEIEGMGGKLLELPKSDWREILEAA